MGGLSFDWKGKEYNIMMEGGCCIFDNDEEEKAFMQWRVTDEGITCCGPVPDDWDWDESQDDDIKLPNFSNFDDWVESHEGRQAMSNYDESKWPKCGVCGARSNCETSIRRYWEPCCMCDAFICESHKAKYCSSKCRAEGRKK